MIQQVLKMRLKNDLGELAGTAEHFHEFLAAREVSADVVYAMDLALEEIVSNVIKYAYEDDREHFIDAEVEVKDDLLLLEIRDDGREFDPFDRPGPDFSIPAGERPVGGLGLHLIRNLLDRLEYRRTGGFNIVRMEKRLVRP